MAETGNNRFLDYQARITQQAQQQSAISILDEAMFRYFQMRRDKVIAELRELDRLLGRAQTIPERKR